jgi:hypothetical protein
MNTIYLLTEKTQLSKTNCMVSTMAFKTFDKAFQHYQQRVTDLQVDKVASIEAARIAEKHYTAFGTDFKDRAYNLDLNLKHLF